MSDQVTEVKEDKPKYFKSERLKNMIGMKVFKDMGEYLIVYRIKRYSHTQNAYIVEDIEGNIHYLNLEDFKDFHILEADGMFMASIVSLKDKDRVWKDVIVSVTKVLELKVGMFQPYAICRQSINDIFYNLIQKTEDDYLAGLSVNRDTCPANFDFGHLMLADSVDYTETIYFYREDTLDDILRFLKKPKDYDLILSNLYTTHAKTCPDPRVSMMKSHQGWCKNLKLLLQENNFQSDIDQMLGITSVAFDMSKYIVRKPLPDPTKGEYDTVTDDLKLWFSGSFRLYINDLTVLEYAHDIDLSELNNTLYFIIRDNQKKLYLCVYTLNGNYLESDLEDAYNKKSFVDEWRINFYNKYKETHPDS